MEVPDPRQVYNGAQRDQAGDKSDIEVVPDTEDEATMPDPSIEARHAMSDVVAMDIKGEVSQHSAQADAVTRSCDAGRGESASGHVQAVTNVGAYQGVPAISQQQYDPMRRSETSGRHSRQPVELNAVTSSCATGRGETMHMRNEVINNEWVSATAQQRYSCRHSRQFNSDVSGTVCRRRGRGRRPMPVHASRAYSSSSGEQRRSFEDLRAELTDAI